ncbi:winged helix-turn-helix domain-containing protein [Winogradskyella sp. A2]|uniref:winged helix-turn-helix domain-containing protein n=1 Tax=Winogradskyella sp. A2 TaxID=3366944 RepID=UPI00398C4EE3
MKDIDRTIQKTIEFPPYLFNYREGSITNRNGIEVFMEPRLKTLFYVLLIHKNDFIERERLMSLVWEDIVVSNQSVTKAISDLRKFLTINGIENIRIVTMSKLGYKLEVITKVKPTLIHQTLKFSAYIFGFLVILILIIRALRYEQ